MKKENLKSRSISVKYITLTVNIIMIIEQFSYSIAKTRRIAVC